MKGRKYQIIYADPPWRFKVWSRDTGMGRSADSHYQTMTLDKIKSLDVPADTNCALFMWATMPMLPEAFQVINSWGFNYKTVGFAWAKLSKRWRNHQKLAVVGDLSPSLFHFGMGYWSRANVEMCLLATRGKIARINAGVRQLVVEPVREHSQKPDVVRDRIVQLMGDLPRLEMFARNKTPGWDCWGNEIQSDAKIKEKPHAR